MTTHQENAAGECQNCGHVWPCPTVKRFDENAFYEALMNDDGVES